jgi:hypothetical protein
VHPVVLRLLQTPPSWQVADTEPEYDPCGQACDGADPTLLALKVYVAPAKVNCVWEHPWAAAARVSAEAAAAAPATHAPTQGLATVLDQLPVTLQAMVGAGVGSVYPELQDVAVPVVPSVVTGKLELATVVAEQVISAGQREDDRGLPPRAAAHACRSRTARPRRPWSRTTSSRARPCIRRRRFRWPWC